MVLQRLVCAEQLNSKSYMNFLDNCIAFYFTTIQLKNHPEILKGKLPTVCMSKIVWDCLFSHGLDKRLSVVVKRLMAEFICIPWFLLYS